MPKSYGSVLEMLRDTFSDEPDTVARYEAALARKELAGGLSVARNVTGTSQAEVAAALGCTQSKLSKLECGEDAKLRLGEVMAYLTAIGCKATITYAPGDVGVTVKIDRVAGFKPAAKPVAGKKAKPKPKAKRSTARAA